MCAQLRAEPAAWRVRLHAAYLLFKTYSPDQPRVPAGSPDGGQWTSGGGGETTLRKPGSKRRHAIVLSDPQEGPLSPDGNAQLIPVSGRPRHRHVWLGNLDIPNDGIDPLDPLSLNEPLSVEEGQLVAETYDLIESGNVFDVQALKPHSYDNYPHPVTGAVLPPSFNGYTAYDVLWPNQAGRGVKRLVIENITGIVYYTNTHYRSFQLVVIKH